MDKIIEYMFKDGRLDKIDIKILDALKEDARMPLTTISSKCRISKQTALYRITKLVTTGIIKGFHAKINYSKLGYNIYYLYLQTRYIDDEEKFVKELSSISGCLVIMHSVTQYGYNLKIITKDIYSTIRELEEFFVKKKNITSHFMLQRLEKSSEIYELDEKDKAIISELSIDCRQNDLELSRKLTMGYDLVHNRVRRLIKDGILEKFQTMIVFESLGFMYYNMLIKFSDDALDKLPLFDSLLRSDLLVLERFRCVGEFSYIFEIIDKDYKSINEKLGKIKSQFYGLIRNSQLVPIENHYFYKTKLD